MSLFAEGGGVYCEIIQAHEANQSSQRLIPSGADLRVHHNPSLQKALDLIDHGSHGWILMAHGRRLDKRNARSVRRN